MVIGVVHNGVHRVVDRLNDNLNKFNSKNMSEVRIERPAQVIKSVVKPIDSSLKIKIAQAFQEVVNKIKEKHLS